MYLCRSPCVDIPKMGFGSSLRHVIGKNCKQDAWDVIGIDGSSWGDSAIVLEAFLCCLMESV